MMKSDLDIDVYLETCTLGTGHNLAQARETSPQRLQGQQRRVCVVIWLKEEHAIYACLAAERQHSLDALVRL